jgi:hypothetical protein
MRLLFIQTSGTTSPLVIITLAIITAVVSIVTAFLAYKSQQLAGSAARTAELLIPKVQEIKITVDGRMAELTEALSKASNLEGAERERVEARARHHDSDSSK